MAGLWRIDELLSRVANVLNVADFNQKSRRNTSQPNVRAVRYYTTLGILDPPSEIRGRVAYYEHKHLLQLVAIKRLQAEGLTLSEIQQGLVGQSESALAQIATASADKPTRTPPAAPLTPTTEIVLLPINGKVTLMIERELARRLDATTMQQLQPALQTIAEVLSDKR